MTVPPVPRLEGTLAEIEQGLRAGAPGAGASPKEARPPVRLWPIVVATVLMAAVPLSGVLVVGTFAGEIIGGIFPAHRNAAAVVLPLAAAVGVAVMLGLARIVALYHRSSALHQIHYQIRRLCF